MANKSKSFAVRKSWATKRRMKELVRSGQAIGFYRDKKNRVRPITVPIGTKKKSEKQVVVKPKRFGGVKPKGVREPKKASVLKIPPLKTWTVESTSTVGKFYTVRLNKDGSLSCNCPAWIFKKKDKPRTCKHVQAIAEKLKRGKVASASKPYSLVLVQKVKNGSKVVTVGSFDSLEEAKEEMLLQKADNKDSRSASKLYVQDNKTGKILAKVDFKR